MSDNFPGMGTSKNDSAVRSFRITATGVLPEITRAIRVDVAGTASLRLKDDTAAVAYTLLAGEFLPISVEEVTAISSAELIGYY